MVVSTKSSNNWGGGGIFIYSGSARLVHSFVIKLTSKEISRA